MTRAIGAALLLLAFGTADATDYFDARVTGIGISTGGDFLRFTIDKDPNVILTTQAFTGEQANRLCALILAAYSAGSPLFYVQTSDSTTSTSLHYAQLSFLSVGARTYD